MPEPINLTLPYPPSVNAYWRIFTPKNGGHPRTIVSKRGRDYKKRVAEIVLLAGRPSVGDSPVGVHIDVYPGTRRKYDLDNIRKAVNDSLQAAGVMDDDAQIVADSASKRPVDKANPRVVVILTPKPG